MADNPSRSWFLTYNHPQETVRYKMNSDGEYILDVNNDRIIESSEPNEYAGLSPEELCDKMLDIWCTGSDTRTAACSYCISKKGLHHLHLVVEDAEPFRFSKVKQAFPKAHIVPTRGNKNQAEDYINKRGKWEEKGEQVLCIRYHGEIKGFQGKRSDLEDLEKMLREGVHPNELLLDSLKNHRYKDMLKSFYMMQRNHDIPFYRDVKLYWHVGDSGSGKTYAAVPLYNKDPKNFYFVKHYRNGFMDKYCGERVLFLDEFKGQLSYSELLTMCEGYKGDIHGRYYDVAALWDEIHISSIYPPERLYKKIVDFYDRDFDTFDQLKRRITGIYYHWRDVKTGEYKFKYVDMKDYVTYGKLVIESAANIDTGFRDLDKEEEKFVQQSFVK